HLLHAAIAATAQSATADGLRDRALNPRAHRVCDRQRPRPHLLPQLGDGGVLRLPLQRQPPPAALGTRTRLSTGTLPTVRRRKPYQHVGAAAAGAFLPMRALASSRAAYPLR